MDSICIEREVLRKNQKDMLEIKNTVTEMNGTRLRKESDIQRPQDIETVSKETFKTEKQREKRVGEKAKKTKQIIPKHWDKCRTSAPKATPGHIVYKL